jgi:hypothetical protein
MLSAPADRLGDDLDDMRARGVERVGEEDLALLARSERGHRHRPLLAVDLEDHRKVAELLLAVVLDRDAHAELLAHAQDLAVERELVDRDVLGDLAAHVEERQPGRRLALRELARDAGALGAGRPCGSAHVTFWKSVRTMISRFRWLRRGWTARATLTASSTSAAP